MKSTVLNTTCLSGALRFVRGGKPSQLSRAHTPARHRTAPARPAVAPTLQGLDFPAYIEQIDLPPAAGASAWQAGSPASGVPRVLHVDTETGTATVLASLLGGEVRVTHVTTLVQARQLLQNEIFSLVILDPALPDGDASALLPLLSGTPLLVYSDQQPAWRLAGTPFLSKSWTSARQLWAAMSTMLWTTSALSAGD